MAPVPFFQSRRRYVIYALLTFAFLGHIPLLQRSIRLWQEPRPADPALVAEQRMHELRSVLHRTRRAGYVTDVPGDSISADAAATERYFLTQYVLAPTVLDRGTAGPLVIGNFAGGRVPERYSSLRVLREFGNGLFLFEGPKP